MLKTDEQLIEEHIAGDLSAFPELLARYLKPVYNFSFILVRDQSDAEDISQETFLKVWKNIQKYTIGKRVKTWIMTIAHNTAIDWIRKKKNVTFSQFENEDGSNVLLDTLTDPEPLAPELFRQAENKKVIERFIQTLPPLYQEVLILRYTEDMTFEEIGLILDRPLHTVKSQHRRTLIRLREFLETLNGS